LGGDRSAFPPPGREVVFGLRRHGGSVKFVAFVEVGV
jgi:hypothetical protein